LGSSSLCKHHTNGISANVGAGMNCRRSKAEVVETIQVEATVLVFAGLPCKPK
jgi:hypothetical protein